MYIHVKVKNTSVYKILQRKAATLERGCFHEYKCIYTLKVKNTSVYKILQ